MAFTYYWRLQNTGLHLFSIKQVRNWTFLLHVIIANKEYELVFLRNYLEVNFHFFLVKNHETSPKSPVTGVSPKMGQIPTQLTDVPQQGREGELIPCKYYLNYIFILTTQDMT
jgi:hypothetical protein